MKRVAKVKRKRAIPKNYHWYMVSSPYIPTETGCYKVAAAHEDQACTIISNMFNISVYLDNENTSIKYLGPVSGNHRPDDRKSKPKKIDKSPKLLNTISGRICPNPNCGYIEVSEGADCCPGCGTEYRVEDYSVNVGGVLN